MKVHELKTWPSFFHEICTGQKTFEFRKNDRDFKENDLLLLKEFDPNCGDHGEYLGGEILIIITKIYDWSLNIGLPEGYVIMQIKRMKVEE